MPAFGIDLGATTTLIARAYLGRDSQIVETEVQKLKQPGYQPGRELNHLPSVAFIPEAGKPVVGLWAKERGPHQDAARCVRAVKQLMGRDLPLERVGWTPAEVAALFLEEVLRQTLYSLDDELTVTVPASYTTNQRRDTLRAIDLAFDRLGRPRLSGEQRERLLISESAAALLAFIAWDMHKAPSARQVDVDARPKVLVYYMDATTLDLGIVELAWRDPRGSRSLDNLQLNVLATRRYDQFGGKDFDFRLAHEFLYPRLLEKFPELEKLELGDEERLALRYDLLNEAERLRIELNEELDFGKDAIYFVTKPLVIRGQEHAFAVDLDRQQYEALMVPFLDEREDARNALWPITQLLKESGIARENVSYFLPVGGMTRLLPLGEALARYWGEVGAFLKFPVRDEAFVQGAAVYSYLKSTQQGFKIEALLVNADTGRPKSEDGMPPKHEPQREDVLTWLIRLFEDYTIRRCWPQDAGQPPTPSVEPTLVFDLSGGKARAIRVDPGHDGHILAELSKFEKVYLAAAIPAGVQDEVDYCMCARPGGKNWKLCAQAAIPELRAKGRECIENIWDAHPDQFPDLLWGLIRWQIKKHGLEQLWFLVSSDEETQMLKAALSTLAHNQPDRADLFQGDRVLLCPNSLWGFAFLDDPERTPQEGEQMLLLHAQKGDAELFEFQRSQGEFTRRYLAAKETIDLAHVNHLALCSDALDRPPDDVLLFRSVDDIHDRAVAHYVVWKLVLDELQAEYMRRRVQQLQRRVAQLESENRDLQTTIQRARRVLERLNTNPPLNIGGNLWQSLELTSAPPPP